MKNQLTAAILASMLAGAGAAAVTTTLMAPSTNADRGRDAAGTNGPRETSGNAGLEEQLARLRKDNEDLRLRVATLERRPDHAVSTRSPEAAPLAAEGLEELDAQVREFMAAFTSQGRVPEVFVARVGDALAEIEAVEERKREEERLAQQAERVEERLVELRDELGLTAYQVDEMRTILTKSEEDRNTLWQSMRDGGGDRGDVREQMRVMREESDTAIAAVLDPTQWERYQESRRADFGRGGFGGFGARGGDAGGGAPSFGNRTGGDGGRRRDG